MLVHAPDGKHGKTRTSESRPVSSDLLVRDWKISHKVCSQSLGAAVKAKATAKKENSTINW